MSKVDQPVVVSALESSVAMILKKATEYTVSSIEVETLKKEVEKQTLIDTLAKQRMKDVKRPSVESTPAATKVATKPINS